MELEWAGIPSVCIVHQELRESAFAPREMLDACAELTQWCDVFCEPSVFDADAARAVLAAGRDAGLLPLTPGMFQVLIALADGEKHVVRIPGRSTELLAVDLATYKGSRETGDRFAYGRRR